MNTSELIYQESQVLPEELRTEVLDFIAFLKQRYTFNSPLKSNTYHPQQSVLETAFAPYSLDVKGITYTREEANER